MRAASIGSGAAASSFASSPSSCGLRRLPLPSSALNSAVSSVTSSPVGLRAITRPPVNACRTNQWYTASALLITSVRFECVNSAIWSTRASSVALRTGCTLVILSSHSLNTHILLQYAHIRPELRAGVDEAAVCCGTGTPCFFAPSAIGRLVGPAKDPHHLLLGE